MSRNNRISHLIILALTALLLAAPAVADPQNKNGKGKDKNDSLSATVSGSLDVMFGDGKSGYISAGISFGDARKLAQDFNMLGQKPLPPGIRKNMARGKPMPPGIAKSRMPGGFIGGLPHHDGYEWQQAGSDLVLVASGTLVISDILEGVFD
jgi:hypothetical protein